MGKFDFFTHQHTGPEREGHIRPPVRLSSRDVCYFAVGILIAYATLGW